MAVSRDTAHRVCTAVAGHHNSRLHTPRSPARLHLLGARVRATCTTLARRHCPSTTMLAGARAATRSSAALPLWRSQTLRSTTRSQRPTNALSRKGVPPSTPLPPSRCAHSVGGEGVCLQVPSAVATAATTTALPWGARLSSTTTLNGGGGAAVAVVGEERDEGLDQLCSPSCESPKVGCTSAPALMWECMLLRTRAVPLRRRTDPPSPPASRCACGGSASARCC